MFNIAKMKKIINFFSKIKNQLVDFSPSLGSEIQDQHPAIIVSVDELNNSPWGLIVVCPSTTFRKNKPFRLHVLISPPEVGIRQTSIIRCDFYPQDILERYITVSIFTLKYRIDNSKHL